MRALRDWCRDSAGWTGGEWVVGTGERSGEEVRVVSHAGWLASGGWEAAVRLMCATRFLYVISPLWNS